MHGQLWRGAAFVKSTYSDPDNCVFVARPSAGPVAVKDGKAPEGPAVTVGRAPWSTFVQWAGR